MRRASVAGTVLAAAAASLAVAVGACGPYAPLAQKLDVTARIAGDTWIAAVGPGRSVTRILLVARPDADGNAPFAFSNLPSGANVTTTTLQGTWTEVGSAGDVTLRLAYGYTLPGDNSGARRDDTSATLRITVARAGDRLVIAGDPSLAGTYVGLAGALRNLGTAAQVTPECAFLVPNLAVMTSDIRIVGFGGGAMSTYQQPADFVGTVAGKVNVAVDVSVVNNRAHTVIRYSGFQDFGGVTLDGAQVTDTTLGGTGQMSGVVGFTLNPAALDPSVVATPIQGSIDYGSAQPQNAVRITNADPTGGAYLMSVVGGASGLVSVNDILNTPSSKVADCLALP